jgi:hypothetical protein
MAWSLPPASRIDDRPRRTAARVSFLGSMTTGGVSARWPAFRDEIEAIAEATPKTADAPGWRATREVGIEELTGGDQDAIARAYMLSTKRRGRIDAFRGVGRRTLSALWRAGLTRQQRQARRRLGPDIIGRHLFNKKMFEGCLSPEFQRR